MTRHSLRKRRKQLGLTQMAISKMSKVSRFRISIFESGYIKLTADEIERLEKKLEKAESNASN